MERLTGEETGSFLVHTVSGSVYLLDLNAETKTGYLTRSPLHLSESMRRDNTTLPLVGISNCKLGHCAVFLVTGASNNPDVVTLRKTSLVTQIVDVSG